MIAAGAPGDTKDRAIQATCPWRFDRRVRGPQFDVTPLEEDTSTLRRLAQADARVVGVSRQKHHR